MGEYNIEFTPEEKTDLDLILKNSAQDISAKKYYKLLYKVEKFLDKYNWYGMDRLTLRRTIAESIISKVGFENFLLGIKSLYQGYLEQKDYGERLELPSNITHFNAYCFRGLSVGTFVIGPNVEFVDEYAFEGATIKQIIIDTQTATKSSTIFEEISLSPFRDVIGLETIIVNDTCTLQILQDCFFSNLSSLKKLIIGGASLKQLGLNLCWRSQNLEWVAFPGDAVNPLQPKAIFRECPLLQHIIFDNNKEAWKSKFEISRQLGDTTVQVLDKEAFDLGYLTPHLKLTISCTDGVIEYTCSKNLYEDYRYRPYRID